MFVTPMMLSRYHFLLFLPPQLIYKSVSSEYLGLPISTDADLNASQLIHSDIATFLIVGDKAETKQMRHEFKHAVKASESISIMCSFKYMGKSKLFVSTHLNCCFNNSKWFIVGWCRVAETLPKINSA